MHRRAGRPEHSSLRLEAAARAEDAGRSPAGQFRGPAVCKLNTRRGGSRLERVCHADAGRRCQGNASEVGCCRRTGQNEATAGQERGHHATPSDLRSDHRREDTVASPSIHARCAARLVERRKMPGACSVVPLFKQGTVLNVTYIAIFACCPCTGCVTSGEALCACEIPVDLALSASARALVMLACSPAGSNPCLPCSAVSVRAQPLRNRSRASRRGVLDRGGGGCAAPRLPSNRR